jgi:hypothetical protein
MKKAFLILVVYFGLLDAFAQHQVLSKEQILERTELRKLNNQSFKEGEILEYVIHYGILDAGTARLELKESPLKINGRKIIHSVGIGKTKGAFDWFFKVRDRYETYMDAEGVFPYLFVRRVDEGGYIINQDYKFHQHKNQVDNGKGEVKEIPEYLQDMLSSFYFARTLDFSTAKKGDIFTINSFVDNEIYPLKIKFVGIENITIRNGTYNCYRFNPVVQQGRIFKKEDDLNVWITNDGNKIPLLAQANLMVGSIKGELSSYSGLANPISKLKK